jgi:hypothetical protein
MSEEVGMIMCAISESNIPLADVLEQATPYWQKARMFLEQGDLEQSEACSLVVWHLVAKILNELDGFDR